MKVRWTVRVPAGRPVRRPHGQWRCGGPGADRRRRKRAPSTVISPSKPPVGQRLDRQRLDRAPRLGATGWGGDAEFDTVNGGITVDLPASASMRGRCLHRQRLDDHRLPAHDSGQMGPETDERQRWVMAVATLSLQRSNGDMELREGEVSEAGRNDGKTQRRKVTYFASLRLARCVLAPSIHGSSACPGRLLP